MLVIRLFRTGKKNQPSFKIIVTEKRRSAKGGRSTEEIGFVNPLTKERKINAERAKYWMSKGAKPSDTVYNLLVKEKIVEGKKIPLHKKSKKQEEVKTAPAAPEAKAVVDKPAEPAAQTAEETNKEDVKIEEIKEEKPEAKPEEKKEENAPKEEVSEASN